MLVNVIWSVICSVLISCVLIVLSLGQIFIEYTHDEILNYALSIKHRVDEHIGEALDLVDAFITILWLITATIFGMYIESKALHDSLLIIVWFFFSNHLVIQWYVTAVKFSLYKSTKKIEHKIFTNEKDIVWMKIRQCCSQSIDGAILSINIEACKQNLVQIFSIQLKFLTAIILKINNFQA